MSRYSKTIALCAAALFASVTVANASAQEAPHAAPWHHHEGMHHDLDKIHAELKLTPDQEQQWQVALSAMKTAHEQEHTEHQQAHQHMQALMQAPILDLQAILAAREQNAEQTHQMHAQTAQAWLKLYDMLDPTQKTLVSTALKAKWEKMAARHEKMAEHWKHEHRDAPTAPAQ